MTRSAALFALAALAAAPAMAGTYSAKPAVQPDTARIVGKNIVWTCAAGSCRGTTEASRPLVICQNLARHAGRIESFLVDGQPLAADQMAKCNASARGGSTELAKAD